MNLLIQINNHILEQGTYWENFMLNNESAIIGFVELLLLLFEMRGIVEEANKAVELTSPSEFYVVGLMGYSLLSNRDKDKVSHYFHLNTGTSDYNEACKKLMEFVSNNKDKGSLKALAILQGGFDWNLNFSSYGELYIPY